MFKVLLVDDEIFLRKGLRNLIDWGSLHFEICGEAENGLEAIQLIEQYEPDLVMVDIRMPVLDGLELIERVMNSGNHLPLFIVVSGYHDFTYAQKALRYNVQDYILKPVDEDELISTLKKVTVTLNQKRLTSIAGEKHLTESILETLIHSEQSEQVIEQISNALSLPTKAQYTYIILEIQDVQPTGKQDYVHAIEQALAPIMEGVKTSLLIHMREQNQYGIIVPAYIKSAWAGFTDEDKWNGLRLHLEKKLNVDVALYVGKEVAGLIHIPQSFVSANQCIDYKFALHRYSLIVSDLLPQTPLYYFDIEEELHQKLIEQIEENKEEAFLATISAIFELFQQKQFSISAVSNTLTRSIISMINIIRQMDGNEEELIHLEDILTWQNKYRNPKQLQEAYERFVLEVAQYLSERRSTQGKGNIEKIKKYIDANYRENMNLKSLAAKFYMNSVYLGQLFRKTYGVYFNEYLLSLRVEEAKRLLRQTDLRMYEVADKVGFQNSDYFVTQFEKIEKMTPTDYRNRMLGKK